MSSDGNLEIKETKKCYQGYIVKLTEKNKQKIYWQKNDAKQNPCLKLSHGYIVCCQ